MLVVFIEQPHHPAVGSLDVDGERRAGEPGVVGIALVVAEALAAAGAECCAGEEGDEQQSWPDAGHGAAP